MDQLITQRFGGSLESWLPRSHGMSPRVCSSCFVEMMGGKGTIYGLFWIIMG
jgi:hypothetical protein